MDPTGQIARRFPLIARPRPICLPLEQRVAQLAELAATADREDDPAAASSVHNLSALLASDCGLPDLARQWCHRQAHAHLRAHPLGAQAARHALEPLVNLARLHIRAGDGERAFTLIHTLYEAVSTHTDTTIDGIAVPAAKLTDSAEAHREVRRWLWATMLATGARALSAAGRWAEARTQMQEHKGIGQRMFDGRQVDVIAHLISGDTSGALSLCTSTAPGEPWENAVTACLGLLCHQPDSDHSKTSILCLGLRPTVASEASAAGQSSLSLFHTRLGLSIIDAIGTVEQPDARLVASRLIAAVTAARDGYAARDLLQHEGCTALLTGAQLNDFTRLITACALDSRALPAPLLAQLNAAIETTEAVITRPHRMP